MTNFKEAFKNSKPIQFTLKAILRKLAVQNCPDHLRLK